LKKLHLTGVESSVKKDWTLIFFVKL